MNIVTDLRVMTCHVIPEKFIKVTQLPFAFMDSVDTITRNAIEFKSRYHKSASVKFHNLSDTAEVERLCRQQLIITSPTPSSVPLENFDYQDGISLDRNSVEMKSVADR